MDTYTLTGAAVAHAAHVGLDRHLYRVGKPERPYYRRPRTTDVDVRAAIGEYLVACLLGMPWNAGQATDTIGLPDVGATVEVRHTTRLDADLAVRRHEADQGRDMVWVYVHDTLTTVTVLGAGNAAWAWQQGTSPAYDTTDTTRVLPAGAAFTLSDYAALSGWQVAA